MHAPGPTDENAELFERLRASISRWTTLTTEEWEKGRPLFQMGRFARNEILVRAGEPSRYLFYLDSGLVRMFYSLENGKEVNKSFAREGMFVAGTLGGQAKTSEYGIQALEDTVTLTASAADMGAMFAESEGWRRLRDQYLSSLAESKAKRERQLLLESAEERYRTFLRDFTDIAGRLPQYQIALYLGITEVALSRIKKRMFAS